MIALFVVSLAMIGLMAILFAGIFMAAVDDRSRSAFLIFLFIGLLLLALPVVTLAIFFSKLT